jgi:hypothetical protein
MEPFTQHFLRLQGGHFDLADRMFNSVREAWLSASKHNMADVKELIPEFFYLPEFLCNSNNFDLGRFRMEQYWLVSFVDLCKSVTDLSYEILNKESSWETDVDMDVALQQRSEGLDGILERFQYQTFIILVSLTRSLLFSR